VHRLARPPRPQPHRHRHLAILHARGQLKLGEQLIHTSIIGSRFIGTLLGETMVGGKPAILPSVSGRAWITGSMSYFLDPSDPYTEGYLVGDTWGVTGKLTQ